MKLTPEKLEEELSIAGDRAPYAIRLIRGHIAALEAELAARDTVPSGQVAEDEKEIAWIFDVAKARDVDPRAKTVNLKFTVLTLRGWLERARDALSRLTADAQTLQNLRATRWKCHCGRPVNLAVIIDATKENPT